MSTEQTFFFHFHFRKDFIERGGNPLAIFAKLRELGDITIIPHLANVPLLSQYHPKELYLKWTLKFVTTEHQSHIERILLPLTADEKNKITLELATLPPPDTETQGSSYPPKILTKKISTPVLHLLAKIGKTIFAIPHALILEFLTVETQQISSATNHEAFFDFKGKRVRILRLHSLLRAQPLNPQSTTVSLVLAQLDSQMFALVIDELVQEYYEQTDQILEDFSRVPFILGAIELENDYVAFILNFLEILSTSLPPSGP